MSRVPVSRVSDTRSHPVKRDTAQGQSEDEGKIDEPQAEGAALDPEGEPQKEVAGDSQYGQDGD